MEVFSCFCRKRQEKTVLVQKKSGFLGRKPEKVISLQSEK
jgi:hypothetical protein